MNAPPSTRWPWSALLLALAWSLVVRIPLVLNATAHLDSDLAVDGLTLQAALQGQGRWHYPGTPSMGSLPLLLSLPQAWIWGPNPATLVSGGVAAHGLLMIAVFRLAWRGFGPGVAGWSLVPLTFASTGALWLSGRITGGHLLTAAWHAAAFAWLWEALAGQRRSDWAILGLWCGLGVWLDAMFLTTMAGLVPAALAASWPTRPTRRGLGTLLIVATAFGVGLIPREIGRWVDPHDAYQDQFRPIFAPEVLRHHAWLLGAECLPRLIVGHRLPGLEADPDPSALAGPGPASSRPDEHPAAMAVTGFGLTAFVAALIALAATRSPPPSTAVRLGLLLSAAAVAAGFVLNRNIFNSDNYRYLVTLLVPWALGWGLAMDGLARRGSGGRAAAGLAGLILAGLMTIDTARWYARLGWIDARGRPVRAAREDPGLAWLDAHREVERIQGDYWDVYRLSFLTAGRVRGVPLPVFPDRFPEWSRDLPGGRPEILVLRPTSEGRYYLQEAMGSGGRVLHQARGITIVTWPVASSAPVH